MMSSEEHTRYTETVIKRNNNLSIIWGHYVHTYLHIETRFAKSCSLEFSAIVQLA